MTHTRKVAILLCTYNGSEYLKKQIDSIIAQTVNDWMIFASDDGSTDETLNILGEYQVTLGREKFCIVKGPGKGFAWNFISLLENSGDELDYYAFCDQDDEWMPEKLATGISTLDGFSCELPSVYCSKNKIVYENNQDNGLSPLVHKTPSIMNAFIQS